MRRIIIAMGSNHQQQTHLDMARKLLRDAFPDVSFTEAIWTEPIGIISDRYLNGLAVAATMLNEEETTAKLKEIERLCGDTHLLRQRNIVNMDLDLLSFGAKRRHEGDWDRPYIKRLLQCLDTSLSSSHSC
ncbi:MAG: 2-amino-4-hydroxy-6-hydroxymethyldihydropteridine diphosphokinase [Prevotella sp.]